jgi:hypothetical protein
MSDLLTTYTTFRTVDYKNASVLSSFSLSATPLVFVADLPIDAQNKVLWSFGDGTTSDAISASKHYTYPGQYTVNLFVYDCFGNVRVSSFSQTVTILDYFPLTFTIDRSDSSYSVLTAVRGQITGPLTFRAQYPLYQDAVDIFYNFHVAQETSYYNISAQQYAHLQNFNCMYDRTYNYYLSSYQFQEIDKIAITPIPIFAKIVGEQIITCDKLDVGAFFVGLSGQTDAYLKSDLLTNSNTRIATFKFDNTNIYAPTEDTHVSYLNNLGISLSAYGVETTQLSGLSITSNGMDGEYYKIQSFDISPIKFENVRIPFVTKVKDISGFSHKSNSIQSSQYYILTGSAPVNSYYYELSSLNSTLSSFDHDGSERHYVKFRNLTDTLSNVSISANFSVTFDISGATVSVSGRSTPFTVYKDKHYEIYKKNEDFDPESTFKDLRFQEFLLDKNVLFEDYLGTIFGNLSSTYDTLGKKIYEKISNFVENNVDVDVDEIYSLISQMEMVDSDTNIYDSTLINYPEKIKRILNFVSISKNRLMGTSNKFSENFDTKGHTHKTEYGTNLGSTINTNSYMITAGTPIVALEKFSGSYTILNTYQPLCAVLSDVYMLSSYTSDWGWPLVLPVGFVYTDFPKYYQFFEYLSGYNNANTNFVIDFGNSGTTILSTASRSDLFDRDGIFENMIANTLYDSLSLFEV